MFLSSMHMHSSAAAAMRRWALLVTSARCSLGFTLPYARRSVGLLGQQSTHLATMSNQSSSSGEQQGSPSPSFAYAYCHGFLSGPGSFKGLALRESMLEVGVDMALLNLNGEGSGPGAMLISGALQAVRQFHTDKKSAVGDPGLKLRLTGSSLGGFIVARYAELYPDEVDRIFMLCPSFCLGTRAPTLASEPEMADWERTGAKVFQLSTGGEASVPWAFVEEAKLQSDYPEYICPAAILHGLNDEVVPVASTRTLVEESSDLAKRTSVMFVEDDHALTQPSTVDLTAKAMVAFYDMEGGNGGMAASDGGQPDMLPSQKNVEVEGKFSADDVDRVKESLLARGGHLIGEHVFWDAYWDAPDGGLTERDWWLRNRAGRWELKMPVGGSGEGVTAYREVILASEIARELKAAKFLESSDRDDIRATWLDEAMLEAAGFEAFACFRTNRAKYRLDGYAVDIDRSSFGHQVVEIETMSGSGAAEVESASDGITAVAQSLGIRRGDASGRLTKGKLLEYITRYCPKQLEVLTRQQALGAKGNDSE